MSETPHPPAQTEPSHPQTECSTEPPEQQTPAANIAEQIAQLETKLAETQQTLEWTRKRKTVLDARQRDRDAIENQRQASRSAVEAATSDRDGWQELISNNLSDDERRTLIHRIHAADQEVEDARCKVQEWTKAVANAESKLAAAEVCLSGLQSEYAEKQKALSNMPNQIKAAQSRIDKLRQEVQAAINKQDWERAFYKNLRLEQELVQIAPLLDSNQTEHTILQRLQQLEGTERKSDEIHKAQEAVDTAKTELAATKAHLQAAEKEYREKQAGLETAIAIFL